MPWWQVLLIALAAVVVLNLIMYVLDRNAWEYPVISLVINILGFVFGILALVGAVMASSDAESDTLTYTCLFGCTVFLGVSWVFPDKDSVGIKVLIVTALVISVVVAVIYYFVQEAFNLGWVVAVIILVLIAGALVYAIRDMVKKYGLAFSRERAVRWEASEKAERQQGGRQPRQSQIRSRRKAPDNAPDNAVDNASDKPVDTMQTDNIPSDLEKDAKRMGNSNLGNDTDSADSK